MPSTPLEWRRGEFTLSTDPARLDLAAIHKWLMDAVVSHPEVQGQRRWVLLTRDAHGLYARHGFEAPPLPALYMERRWSDVYRAPPKVQAGG